MFAGFPEQTADLQEPALLWAELTLIDGLLTNDTDDSTHASYPLLEAA